MKKNILLPGLALAGGAAGFFLRRGQLALAYDANSHLFTPGSPMTWALLGLLTGLAVLFVLFARVRPVPGDFLPAFRCPSPLYMSLMAAGAFLLMGGGVLGLLDGMELVRLWRAGLTQLSYPAAALLCALLCFPSGAALLFTGRCAYRGELSAGASFLSSFPAFAALAWLFTTHLDHSTDPILMGYGFTLAAAALLMLAHYYAAAFFFGHCCPARMVACALLGTVLGLTSLADRPSRFVCLLTLGFSLSALAQTAALLGEHSLNDLDEGV